MKKLYKILSGLLVSLLIVGIVFAANPISVDRGDLSFYFDGGNNNGTNTVWETSGNGLNLTETGTVTFTDDYVEFPGTANNYLSGTGTGVFNTANVCMLFVFEPDFNAADDNYIVLIDGDNGNRYGVHKTDDGLGNVMYILLGSTIVGNIPLATYEPYWLVGEENILVVSGTTGNNNVWLNGTQILTSGAIAWTPKNPSIIYVGASFVGTSNFDGKISSYRIWNRQCTTSEVTRYSANRLTNIKSAVTDGMMAYLNFDLNDINGTDMFDKSVYKDNATNSGSSNWTNGVIREARDFNGTSDYVSLGNTNLNSVLNATSPFTISLWYKQDVQEQVNILGYYDNPKYIQLFMLNDTGQVLARVGAGAGGNLPTITSTPGHNNTDTWYNVVYTYDGTSLFYLYINNVQVGTVNQTPSAFNSTKNIHIGRLNHTSPLNFDGKIDDVRIYDRVLTAAERTNNYNATKMVEVDITKTWNLR